MSETPTNDGDHAAAKVTLAQIFLTFLLIGATSFGGGVAAYLRTSLVARRQWIDDPTFVSFLAISQTLPGLNATNMAILVGDHLRGGLGAAAAIIGMCLPGALIMFAAGVLYGLHGERPIVTAMLHGVGAAAVGLVFAVSIQLGRKSLTHLGDLVFVVLTLIGVNLLSLSVLYVLLGVGALAIWWHRPRRQPTASSPS